MITVEIKTLDQLVFDEIRTIAGLRMIQGQLLPTMIWWKNHCEDHKNRDCCRVYLARVDGKILGWGFSHPHDSQEMNLMLYVKKKNRRQGIGTAIVNAAQDYAKSKRLSVWVNKWGYEQIAFFKTFKGLKG